MAPKKIKIQIIIIILLFFIYFVIAARPIPRETILAPGWIRSVFWETLPDGDEPENIGISLSGSTADSTVNLQLPFVLGDRFGYVDSTGQFVVNKVKTKNIYLSKDMWTEYDAVPSNIEIKDILGETIVYIENPGGYPFLLDNRIFIFGSEHNSLSEIDRNGNIMWTYEFSAPLVCVDVAAGLVLAGSLDGVIEILDSGGDRIFYFKPGGSKIEAIYGCALSSDGAYLGIICGLEPQRFILLERFGSSGGEYRIIYHEFLEAGFRREVKILFIDNDRRIIFEREGGIGSYSIISRRSMFIPLDGKIAVIDGSGDKGILFLITSDPAQTEDQFSDFLYNLIGIKFPHERRFLPSRVNTKDTVFLRASFRSSEIFLGRTGGNIIAGGGTTLISFNLEEK